MGYRDNVNKVGTLLAGFLLPAVTATTTGPTIDTMGQGGYNAATLYLLAGTWTDGSHTYTLQEAPDIGNGTVQGGIVGTWQNVGTNSANDFSKLELSNPAGGLPITILTPGQPQAITSAATALNQRVGYLGGYRYLRVICTVAGATTGARHMPLFILGEPRVLPAAV